MRKIISLADQRNFGFLEAVIAMMLTIMVIETINVTASTCFYMHTQMYIYTEF